MTDVQTKTYRGNCHCGAFIYEATLPEIKSVHQCNCSICSKKGYLWAPLLNGKAFKVVKGNEDDLSVYYFGPKKRPHKFCSTCGSALLGRQDNGNPDEALAINARCLQDLDTWKLDILPLNGGALAPSYQAPEYTGPKPSTDADPAQVYHGSCHCGAVTLALKTQPLDDKYEGRIMECNCSIDQRNGYVWIYPKPEEVIVQGEDNITKYAMGQNIMHKTFCKICGVQLTNIPNKLSDAEVAALPTQAQEFYKVSSSMLPVNLRTLNNFDLASVKTTKVDGFNLVQPGYVNP